MIDIVGEIKDEHISSFKDPFLVDKVQSMFIHMYKSPFDQTISWSGSIDFKNGQTKGTQHFQGLTLEEVLIKMKVFLDNDLSNKQP